VPEVRLAGNVVNDTGTTFTSPLGHVTAGATTHF
jgi:hypothetical protein